MAGRPVNRIKCLKGSKFLHNILSPLLLREANACLHYLVPITTCHSVSNKWQIKAAAGQMNEGRGLIPEDTWSGSIPLFLLKPKLAHVRDTRSSNQPRCQKGHGLRTSLPCARGLEPRQPVAAKGGVTACAVAMTAERCEMVGPLSPVF